MSISNKYGIPEETFKKMVNDGLISCSWPVYDEVYTEYKRQMSVPGAITSRVEIQVADKFKMSDRNVRKIVKRFS